MKISECGSIPHVSLCWPVSQIIRSVFAVGSLIVMRTNIVFAGWLRLTVVKVWMRHAMLVWLNKQQIFGVIWGVAGSPHANINNVHFLRKTPCWSYFYELDPIARSKVNQLASVLSNMSHIIKKDSFCHQNTISSVLVDFSLCLVPVYFIQKWGWHQLDTQTRPSRALFWTTVCSALDLNVEGKLSFQESTFVKLLLKSEPKGFRLWKRI